MGTKKHHIVSELTKLCAERGFVVVEVANREVGEDAKSLLKDALNHSQPVSVKLKEIDGGKAFSIDLNVNDSENGTFIALTRSNEFGGIISRFPTKGYELSGRHIFFKEESDFDKFAGLKKELYAK